MRYVEGMSEVRTKSGSRRVLARQGRAGEKGVAFNGFLFVVLVFRVQYLLSFLLFHRVMQEHADKH